MDPNFDPSRSRYDGARHYRNGHEVAKRPPAALGERILEMIKQGSIACASDIPEDVIVQGILAIATEGSPTTRLDAFKLLASLKGMTKTPAAGTGAEDAIARLRGKGE